MKSKTDFYFYFFNYPGTYFWYVCILWLHDEVFTERCGVNVIRLRQTGRPCWTHRPAIQAYIY